MIIYQNYDRLLTFYSSISITSLFYTYFTLLFYSMIALSQQTDVTPVKHKVSIADMRKNFSKVAVAEPTTEESTTDKPEEADLPVFPKIR